MFVPDMPNVPPQNVPVMIAQASQMQQDPANTNRTVGVCQALSNPPLGLLPGAVATAQNSLTPAGDAIQYFRIVENRAISGSSTVTVLENPKHGKLEDLGTVVFDENGHAIRDTGERSYNYIPESGYLGQDSATLLVEIGGFKVKMVYTFKVATAVDYKNEEVLCPKPYWRISSTLDANGNSTITSIEYQSPTIDVGATTTNTAALDATLGSSILSTLSIDPSLVTP